MIPQFCTTHPVLRIKTRNQRNERARIPRTQYCFSIHGPEVEITCDDRNHVNFILLSVVSLSIFTTEVQNLKEHFR